MSPTRIVRFRLSLLVSLGIVPAACGGATRDNPNDDAGGSGGSTSTAGTPSTGGTAGMPSTAGGTSAAGATSTAGTASTGGRPAQIVPCTSPVEDPITGLVSCAEGFVHRPTALACGAVLQRPANPGSGAPAPQPLPRADGTVSCTDDPNKCSAFQYGYCKVIEGAPELSTCHSGCAIDQHCGPSAFCACGDAQSPTGGVCQPSHCATDADCQPGYLCATYTSMCGAIFDVDAPHRDFTCQTPQDECVADKDCVDAGGLCTWTEGGRVCQNANPACGRPFLVDARPRLAPAVVGGAWAGRDALEPRVDHLTAEARAAQAAHWTQLGQMEHASIAAFARFSLQLLSLGAPPELVDACTQALADETAHTKLCFQLASAYAGYAIGPGPLDIGRSLEVTALEQVVELVIAEGCFGETRAALEALEAADAATDPVIAAAYARIARDEQRHAELAFRFVRWALARGGQPVRERVAAVATDDFCNGSVARGVVAPCLRGLLQLEPPV